MFTMSNLERATAMAAAAIFGLTDDQFLMADQQADLDQAAAELEDWDGGDNLPPLKPQDASGNWSD